MNQEKFQALLNDLKLGKVAYFQEVSSTNDIASEWVKTGAPNFSIIAADSQTQGRGRAGRTWHTYPGSALAISIILKPQADLNHFSRFTALGAISVCRALAEFCTCSPSIKWPNDVLIENKKVAGILTEVEWSGSHPKAVIIGIGVNITVESLPKDLKLPYPAGHLDSFSPTPTDRFQVLHRILTQIKSWYPKINSDSFIQEWESLLAFRNKEIEILLTASPTKGKAAASPLQISGKMMGIDQTGMLLVKLPDGEIKSFTGNEIRILHRD